MSFGHPAPEVPKIIQIIRIFCIFFLLLSVLAIWISHIFVSFRILPGVMTMDGRSEREGREGAR